MNTWLPPTLLGLSAFVAWITTKTIRPLLVKSDLIGRDLHKPERPEIAEMGGLGLVASLIVGYVLSIGILTILNDSQSVNELLAVLSTVLIVSFIGVFDDLLEINQSVKALTPIFAALPLMAIRAGVHFLRVPLVGRLELGIAYPLVLIPLGITGAANAVNMLAGFNGLEVGVSTIAIISLGIIALHLKAWTAFLILVVALGALIVLLYFNWYPAEILIGDVGTLAIGAVIATSTIIGNFEAAGLIIVIPHIADFTVKAYNGFPSEGWHGELGSSDGKLHCKGSPISLPQVVMKLSGGITESGLTIIFVFLEAIFGFLALVLYL